MKLNAKELFETVISRQQNSVEEIANDLFTNRTRSHWDEFLELLKQTARSESRNHASKMSLLTLYWLSYEEQVSSGNIPREGHFLADREIPILILEEGEKVLNSLRNGVVETESLEYLRYVVEALGDLRTERTGSLRLLDEIEATLATIKPQDKVVERLKKCNQVAKEKRQTESMR